MVAAGLGVLLSLLGSWGGWPSADRGGLGRACGQRALRAPRRSSRRRAGRGPRDDGWAWRGTGTRAPPGVARHQAGSASGRGRGRHLLRERSRKATGGRPGLQGGVWSWDRPRDLSHCHSSTVSVRKALRTCSDSSRLRRAAALPRAMAVTVCDRACRRGEEHRTRTPAVSAARRSYVCSRGLRQMARTAFVPVLQLRPAGPLERRLPVPPPAPSPWHLPSASKVQECD